MSKFTRTFGATTGAKVRPSIAKLSLAVEEITPAAAEGYLAKSKRKNRRDVPAKITQFAAAMAAGKWSPYNSTAISFDTKGDLVNGHNRLKACIRAGVPFRSIVVRGVPPETYETEDTGQFRTAADFLEIAGEQNGRMLSAAGRCLCLWDRGKWRHATFKGSRPDLIVRNDQLLAEVQARPILRKAAAWLADHSRLYRVRTRKLHTGLVGAMWCLTSGHKRHEAFWSELVDGTGVAADSPVKIFRDRVEGAAAKGQKLKTTTLAALLTKTWNAYALERTVEKLQWAPGKERAFPQPLTKMVPLLIDREAPEARAA